MIGFLDSGNSRFQDSGFLDSGDLHVRKNVHFTDDVLSPSLSSFLPPPLVPFSYSVPSTVPSAVPSSHSRHRVFAAKVCIANIKPSITGKILQRHRLFGSKECVASGGTVISDRKSVSRTVWVQNSVSREKEVDFMRQASQQEPPCGISQKGKGCGQGGGRSRRP